MASPFPGMDPYIESLAWSDFHHHFLDQISAELVPLVRPRYVVRVELRVYLEHAPPEPPYLRPDLAVIDTTPYRLPRRNGGGVATISPTAVLTLPMPEEQREAYLTIRLRETEQVVTTLELLSPGNKRAGSDGRREYLDKRELVLRSRAHLIELDLLRRGERLPTREPLPPGDYFALVSSATRRPSVDVFAWTLRQRLPTIPVPLSGDDPAVELDLQGVFVAVYSRMGYDYSLDRGAIVDPPLSESDLAWVAETVEG